jgi:hypothetical protein
MSARTLFLRLTVRAAAVAALAWTGGAISAADVTPVAPTVPVVGAPVVIGDPGSAGCESCQHGAIRSKCNACGTLLSSVLPKGRKTPSSVSLCPGACFGYFQTQWRKWDEACPYPYQGIGASDALKLPGARPNELNQPRPTDPKLMPEPKKTGSTSLPPIPAAPKASTASLPPIPAAPAQTIVNRPPVLVGPGNKFAP